MSDALKRAAPGEGTTRRQGSAAFSLVETIVHGSIQLAARSGRPPLAAREEIDEPF